MEVAETMRSHGIVVPLSCSECCKTGSLQAGPLPPRWLGAKDGAAKMMAGKMFVAAAARIRYLYTPYAATIRFVDYGTMLSYPSFDGKRQTHIIEE